MADEKKSLEDWGIDVDRFKERAKESFAAARGDFSEITGTLRSTLVQAKNVLVDLQSAGSPAAAELRSGFERAWHEIETAFRAARAKARPADAGADESAGDDPEPPSPS